VLNPLTDARAERDETALRLLRELDARAGEEDPLTA
jgi:hypothetical protein